VVRYDLPTAILLSEARTWYQAGVKIIGGCCGTAPEHIKALQREFGELSVKSRTGRFTIDMPAEKTVARTENLGAIPQEQNPLRRVLRDAPRPLVAVEIRASLNRPLAETIQAAKVVADARPDFFDVPDNPGANPGRDCVACAFLLQQQYEIPTIIHKSATQTNALHLHSYLLGAADLGVRGVLAVTGDPPHVGPFDRWASRVNDIKSSVELLRLMTLMRSGELLSGQPLPEPVDFLAGCAYAPTLNLSSQTQWLKRKVQAGAEFVFTQPIYLYEDFDKIQKATLDIHIPMFIGILPLTSARQIAYLRSGKIPGIQVPDQAAQFILRYNDAESQAKAGMEYAERLIVELAERAFGFYLVMPFHKNCFELSAGLVKRIATFKKKKTSGDN